MNETFYSNAAICGGFIPADIKIFITHSLSSVSSAGPVKFEDHFTGACPVKCLPNEMPAQ
jgi:hypothetical protein